MTPEEISDNISNLSFVTNQLGLALADCSMIATLMGNYAWSGGLKEAAVIPISVGVGAFVTHTVVRGLLLSQGYPIFENRDIPFLNRRTFQNVLMTMTNLIVWLYFQGRIEEVIQFFGR